MCKAMEQSPLDLDQTRQLRQEIGNIIDTLQNHRTTRSSALAITKLQEGKMWLGMHMGEVGGEDLNSRRDKEILSNK